jgi:NAD(P)-dependent dehydrogenase (short-subunit alcohol dehydrogenase family)
MADQLSKAVLITGCSSGIGRVTAERLAENGWTVYATARRPDPFADLAEKGCRTLQLDVTDDASARAAVAAVEEAEGAVGVLVNNAGYAQQGALEATPLDDVREMYETNVLGYMRMAQLVLPGMRRQGWGRIVNLSSIAGRVVFPGAGLYSSTKYAVEALSDALRFEVQGFGVAVSLVEPGPIRTAFTDTANESYPAPGAAGGVYDAFHEAVAKGDKETDESFIAGDPEDVAKAIERAISARRPKPRYKVTAVARLMPKLHGVLPDRAFDAFLRTQAQPPGD